MREPYQTIEYFKSGMMVLYWDDGKITVSVPQAQEIEFTAPQVRSLIDALTVSAPPPPNSITYRTE